MNCWMNVFGHLKEVIEDIESKSVLERRHLYQSQSF